MADKKISALTGATTPLAGTEVLPIVQGGATVKVSVADLTAGRAVSMLGFTSSADSVITSANAAGGAGLFVKNTGDAPALTQYSYVNFSTGSDDGQSSIRSYRTNPGSDFQTRLTILVNPSGATHTPIEAFNAESDGAGGTRCNIQGNLVIGTSGKGIDFSATAGTGTSELLADYEEGEWTPVIRGSGTAGTYEQVVTRALYTKVGRQVTLQCYITLAAVVTGGGTGYLQITGAPFTAFSPNQFPATILLTDMAKSLTTLYVGVSFANTTIMYCPEVQPTAYADFPIANAVANKTIQFTMTYFTA